MPPLGPSGLTLAARQLVYVGLRDIDDQERRMLRQLNIKAFTMQHVDKYGIGKVRAGGGRVLPACES